MKTIRVVFCDVLATPVVQDVEAGYKGLQRAVQGTIDVIRMVLPQRDSTGLNIWINDEGVPAALVVPKAEA
jgi:hypothetical protein